MQPQHKPLRNSLLAAFCCILFVPSVAGQNLRPSRLLTEGNTTDLPGAPNIASDSERTAIAWVDGATQDVLVSISDGTGVQWSPPIRMDDDTTQATKILREDSLAVVGNSIYVAWHDERDTLNGARVHYNYSDNGGFGWAGDTVVDDPLLGTPPLHNYDMTVTSNPLGGPNLLHIAIVSRPTSGAPDILNLFSFTNGSSFNPAIPLTAENDDVNSIDIYSEGLNVYVAWFELTEYDGPFYDTWWQQSSDGGLTWLGAAVRLDTTPNPGAGLSKDGVNISASGSNIAVIWGEERTHVLNDELRLRISTDGGQSWGASDLFVGTYNPVLHDTDHSKVCINSDRLWVGWRDDRTGMDTTYYTISEDLGVSWTPDTPLPGSSGPEIDSRGDVWVVSFTESAANQRLAVYSFDSGATFSPAVNLTPGTQGGVEATALAINPRYNNLVHAYFANELGFTDLFVGGFRPQTLETYGTFSANQPVRFLASGFPEDANWSFGVLVSGGRGTHTFADGRFSGLSNDAILGVSEPLSTSTLAGALNDHGSGGTSFVLLPTNLPAGLIFHCTAFAFDGFGGLGSITDVVVEPIQ